MPGADAAGVSEVQTLKLLVNLLALVTGSPSSPFLWTLSLVSFIVFVIGTELGLVPLTRGLSLS